MYITNVNSGVITVLSLESVSIGGDGRIFQTYGDSGVEYSYDFYLKDHLGSTRMVINSQDQITEAVAYQAYGAMVPLDSIANAPEIPAREKFTGKEFDQEGEDSANGVAGIQAYHFGARVYDPDVGVWLSVDPAEQFWNSYSYCGAGPVNYIDPDGAFVPWGMIAGVAIGATVGGIYAYNNDMPVLGGMLAGAGIGGLTGGMLWDMPVAVLMDNGFNIYQRIGNIFSSMGDFSAPSALSNAVAGMGAGVRTATQIGQQAFNWALNQYLADPQTTKYLSNSGQGYGCNRFVCDAYVEGANADAPMWTNTDGTQRYMLANEMANPHAQLPEGWERKYYKPSMKMQEGDIVAYGVKAKHGHVVIAQDHGLVISGSVDKIKVGQVSDWTDLYREHKLLRRTMIMRYTGK